MSQEQVIEQPSSTATKPGPRPQQPKVDQMPPWKVLLHNDEVNDMGYVVETIVELTTLRKQMAIQRMFEAHRKGLTLLLATHREHAELLQEQFKSKRLKVTIEPDE